jgi:hypothetical protein
MRIRTIFTVGLLATALAAQPVTAAAKKKNTPEVETDAFSRIVETLDRREGLLTFYVDKSKGQVWLELPATLASDPLELLYVEGLLSGLGSNPVGLDRGQLGSERLVSLRRLGGKLLIEHLNLGYRATSDNPLEVKAVRTSFATSVLWAGEVAAEAADGRALVDLTSFLVRDAHGVATTLKRSGQGSFTLDPARSSVDPEACLAFPDNIELEAVLTWGGTDPGRHVRQTAPTAEAITLIQHHSFIRLPDDGYRPRAFDPRAGSFAIQFADYAAGLDEPLRKHWIVRHRLEKTDPGAERSPVKEPIVYYVDSGAPAQIQQALIDGASWWADAFDAAGFIDAYRVELLPADAHPLDVRYNVIQWVHRSTRGWSYGGGITDPRTGEMIKGHVSLGSLRVRQDRLIFEGLAGADATGSGAPDDPVEIALARIRQLSAHEVGHTLGFTHNFAASTYGRASVMDYPAPLVTHGADGRLDFSDAYGVGVGEWDDYTVRYAYSEFPPGVDESAVLEQMVRDAASRGLLFVTDADARPDGAAHPIGNLWDNGAEPVSELQRLAAVRSTALATFGQSNIAAGQPLSLLHETLVPIYLLHRFQIRAAAKVVGGLDYRYAVRGDEAAEVRLLEPEWQRRALGTLLDRIEPEELDLPEPVLELLLPRPFGYGGNRELFGGATSPAFDALGAAATLSDMVLDLIVQPERLARLVDHHRRDPSQPSLEEVLSTVIERLLPDSQDDARQAELRRVTQAVFVARLIEVARAESTPPRVRYRLEAQLRELEDRLDTGGGTDVDMAFRAALIESIVRYRTRTEEAAPLSAATPEAPPGQPIGTQPWNLSEASGCSWSDPSNL